MFGQKKKLVLFSTKKPTRASCIDIYLYISGT